MKICVNLFLAASGLSCSMGDPHCGAGVQFKAPELVGSAVAILLLQGMWDLSSPTQYRTHILCTGRLTLNPWASWDIPSPVLPFNHRHLFFSTL